MTLVRGRFRWVPARGPQGPDLDGCAEAAGATPARRPRMSSVLFLGGLPRCADPLAALTPSLRSGPALTPSLRSPPRCAHPLAALTPSLRSPPRCAHPLAALTPSLRSRPLLPPSRLAPGRAPPGPGFSGVVARAFAAPWRRAPAGGARGKALSRVAHRTTIPATGRSSTTRSRDHGPRDKALSTSGAPDHDPRDKALSTSGAPDHDPRAKRSLRAARRTTRVAPAHRARPHLSSMWAVLHSPPLDGCPAP